MKMIINETGVQESLSIIDSESGIDWTEDLIGNTGAIGNYIQYDKKINAYHISQENFDWWANYIKSAQEDSDKLEELKDLYEYADMQRIIEEEFDGINDYGDHHNTYQEAFRRIEDELEPIR